jgi:hypothetical protein
MMNIIAAFGGAGALARKSGRLANERLPLFQQTLAKIMARGPDEAAMVTEVLRAASRKPATFPAVAFFLSRYEQFRYFLGPATGEACRMDAGSAVAAKATTLAPA